MQYICRVSEVIKDEGKGSSRSSSSVRREEEVEKRDDRGSRRLSNEIIGGGNACFLITGYCSRREASGLTHMRTRTRLPRLKRRHVHEREGLIDDEVRKREGGAGDERDKKTPPALFGKDKKAEN